MLPLADIIQAVVDSDGFGQFIIIVQIVLSLYAWSSIISRHIDLKRMSRQNDDFRHVFGRSRSIVDYYFTHASGNAAILRIYGAATERLVHELGEGGAAPLRAADAHGRIISEASFDLVKGVAEESLAKQNSKIENGMGFLGAVATLAPLFGLFGTVWGVMNAFQDMGREGAVNLATVAPSLSTAMATTVVGIAVAIPTIFGYNSLVERIEKVKLQFDGFADEYLGRLKREFREGSLTGAEGQHGATGAL